MQIDRLLIAVTAGDDMQREKLLDFVHDRVFEISSVKFNESQGKFVIPLSVVLYDTEIFVSRHAYCIVRYAHPVVSALLTVENVQSYELVDKADIDGFMIDEIFVTEQSVEFTDGFPGWLTMRASNPTVILETSTEIIDYDYFYRISFKRH